MTEKNIRGREKMILTIVVSLLIIIAFLPNVSAMGIAPSKQVIDYLPEKSMTFEGKVMNNEEKFMRVVIVPKGSMKEYIKIENQILSFKPEDKSQRFTYDLKFPMGLKPGKNKFDITFTEIPSDFDKQVIIVDEEVLVLDDNKATVTTSQAIVQPIIVNVPYPGTYIDSKLHVSEAHVGDPVVFTMGVFNRGKDTVDVQGYVIIKGPTNEELARIDTSSITSLASNEESKVIAKLDTNGWEQGVYYAQIVLQYGDESLTLEESFTIGNMFIKIDNLYVDNFRLGAIAKINVDLLSKWNKPIDEVYGEIQVIQDESILAELKTAEVYIPDFGKETIVGYWDTEGVNIGEYDFNVELKYSGKSTKKLFSAVVSINDIQVKDQIQIAGKVAGVDEEGTQYSLMIILVVTLIIINIALFFFISKGKFRRGPPPEKHLQYSSNNPSNKNSSDNIPEQNQVPKQTFEQGGSG